MRSVYIHPEERVYAGAVCEGPLRDATEGVRFDSGEDPSFSLDKLVNLLAAGLRVDLKVRRVA